jgi:hypothetical protein
MCFNAEGDRLELKQLHGINSFFFFEKPIVEQLVTIFHGLYEHEGALTSSEGPASESDPKPNESSSNPHITFLISIQILCSLLPLGFQVISSFQVFTLKFYIRFLSLHFFWIIRQSDFPWLGLPNNSYLVVLRRKERYKISLFLDM